MWFYLSFQGRRHQTGVCVFFTCLILMELGVPFCSIFKKEKEHQVGWVGKGMIWKGLGWEIIAKLISYENFK